MHSTSDLIDPRLPDPEDCVIRYLMERNARDNPDRIFVRFQDGTEWTYAQALALVKSAAAGLKSLGVNQGDHVLTWLPPGEHALRAWLGAAYLGAVHVPLNLAYKGQLLGHVVNLSDAKVAVVHAELAGRLSDVDLHLLKDVVIVGGPAPDDDRFLSHPECIFDTQEDPGETPARIMPWHRGDIIFTSGTTGPSKGVLRSYAQMWHSQTERVDPDNRALVTLPLFHIGGTGPVYSALCNGSSVAIKGAFRTDMFWETIRETGATSCILLGAMTQFLIKQPPSPQDRNHSLKRALMVPWTEDAQVFAERFGVELWTMFNMTELSVPIVSQSMPETVGTAGKCRNGFEIRLVDENDCEVPIGEIGELVCRSDMPWAINSGYYKNPEATARAWRNGWFHTGDGFRRDDNGYYFFVDRIKDSIRRRGENISSFEVEAEVLAHPSVYEAAAIAVPSELGEDEVMICVAPVPGKEIDPATLIRDLILRMTHFMVPRYVRILPQLPKTPTQKIQKHLLRAEGVTTDTWDREAQGVVVKRDRIAGV